MPSEPIPLLEYRAKDNPHPDDCDGHGYVEVQIDGEQRPRVQPCPGCRHEQALEQMVGFIPPRFHTVLPLPDEIKNWIRYHDQDHEPDGLYLCGPVGAGKTHMAYSAILAWCYEWGIMPRQGRSKPGVVFYRATRLLDELRPGNDDHRQVVEQCQRAELLVIDDLGAEKATEWTVERLYEVIDERYAHRRPIIVTSNVPPPKLTEHVGERVASRFAEMCRVVPVTGADRRRAPAMAGATS